MRTGSDAYRAGCVPGRMRAGPGAGPSRTAARPVRAPGRGGDAPGPVRIRSGVFPSPAAGRAGAGGRPGGPGPTLDAVDEMPRDDSRRLTHSVRVLLAEDRTTTRGALALLLGMEADLTVVAQAARGDEVVDAALLCRPDVALLDVELPGTGGVEATAALRREVPDCRVLILAGSGRGDLVRRALEAGAAGVLVKDGPVEDLTEAIRQVLTGATVVDPALCAPDPHAEPR